MFFKSNTYIRETLNFLKWHGMINVFKDFQYRVFLKWDQVEIVGIVAF